MQHHIVTLKLTNVLEVHTASIIRAIHAERTCETLVNFNMTTLHYIPEDAKLLIRHVSGKTHPSSDLLPKLT
jgi:hypothetical protein